jgi:hypothetical protein
VIVPAARLPRSRIDRATARTIDRLARRAHRFHRFAHHPLCARYAGEVIRLRRVRVCRGCTYALVGGLAGTCAGLAIGGSPLAAAIALAAGTVLLGGSFALRPPKVAGRLVPAGLMTLAITCGVTTVDVAGIAIAFAAIAIVLLLRLLYRRRGPDRTACTTCPERSHDPCSGYAPIVSRERAFQRVANQVLRRSAG